ncbi:MAG: class I SAM-dependent methyltransferase [Acaryochloridaceae cyanobacterium SU_2_1]|nr:class I SAM-dependent methyltransferase [Acaryochloridaceae cyanobacterium SU_2_1]NJM95234.1 class I SAM-dependent methyltransferase [Acaryochloridaceae cyanobacterium CSU_5_19]
MLSGNTDYDWEFYGKTNPYFGVVSWDKFKQENLSAETLEEFFETGQQHVNRILKVVHEQLDPAFRPQDALDFGCGVGRIVVPLAQICESVTGVDVSESMLKEAKKNCQEKALSNTNFVKGNDSLSDLVATGKKFNFIHSFIVFQHIPCDRGEAILKTLLGMLEDGGVGVLHFTYFKKISSLSKLMISLAKIFPFLVRLRSLVKGEAYRPMMQMNAYDLNSLFHILQEHHCLHAAVRFTCHWQDEGVILFFQKTGQPIP